MDFIGELEKATAGMSVEQATKIAKEMEASIEARELRGECDCGDRCSDPLSHNAIDRMTLCQMKIIISQGGTQ